MIRALGLLLAFVATGVALAAPAARDAGLQPVPALTRPVTDLTGTLPAADVARIEAKLQALHTQHGPQFSVLVVQTTQPETAFDYSMRVVEQWKPGDAKRDDGLLLLVALKDRKFQVQVGYGLEGVIPDAVASRVTRNELVPRFRAGDYAGGIEAAIDAFIAAATGGAVVGEPAPAGDHAAEQPARDADGRLFISIGAGLAIGLVLAMLLGRVTGALIGGGASLLLALVFSLGFGAALFLAFVVFVFVIGKGGMGGFGGGFGGGRGGMGSMGGGWRGGGGGFGGGGASGGW